MLASRRSLVAIAYRYANVSHPVLRDVQQRMADVATVAEENIVGVHVVKSFAQEQAEQDKFERRSEAVFVQSVRANRQRAFYVPVLGVPAAARAGGGAARRRPHGRERRRSRSREFVSFNLYLAMLSSRCGCSGCGSARAQRAIASGERIFQVMDEPEDIRDAPDARELPPGPGPRALRGRHVRLRARRGRCCDGIDLELEPGRTVALIGAHGLAARRRSRRSIPRFYDVQAGPRHGRRRRRARR